MRASRYLSTSRDALNAMALWRARAQYSSPQDTGHTWYFPRIGEPQYRSQNITVLTTGTPKKAPNSWGNPHFYDIKSGLEEFARH